MRNKFSQISLFDIYSDVSSAINNREPSFLDLLDEHLDLSSLQSNFTELFTSIPAENAFTLLISRPKTPVS